MMILSSLAMFWLPFDSMAFKKFFPEYVEKYNELQQQMLEQTVPDENHHLHRRCSSTGTETIKADEQKEVKRNRKQGIPTWVLVLFVSIFGIVMSLPLLQF